VISTLIKIGPGKWKCVLNQFYSRLCVIRDDDFHDIESEKDVGIVEHSQPGQRAARNSLPFFAIHRFEGPAEIFARTCLYFDKHERVVVAANNVDLTAAATTKITEEDFIAVTLEVAAR
jgi:hypothetical protein